MIPNVFKTLKLINNRICDVGCKMCDAVLILKDNWCQSTSWFLFKIIDMNFQISSVVGIRCAAMYDFYGCEWSPSFHIFSFKAYGLAFRTQNLRKNALNLWLKIINLFFGLISPKPDTKIYYKGNVSALSLRNQNEKPDSRAQPSGRWAGFYWPTLALLAGLSQTKLVGKTLTQLVKGRPNYHCLGSFRAVKWLSRMDLK